MKHHFADLLNREQGYWTIVPNIEKYAYSANAEIPHKEKVKILTVSKDDKHWQQVFDCPNIEELSLLSASKEQFNSIQKLPQLKRLRITFFRTNDITPISHLPNLEELVLEYVSGFSDLAPLQKLPKLISLHLENLQGVTNFDGLKGLSALKCLSITGTLDWNQPIADFTFLEGLPHLEDFSLGFVINKTEFPAFLPILKLKSLKKIAIGRATFPTNEYAFLQAALPNVEGCSWELCWAYEKNYEFLGKRAGRVNQNNPKANERCEEFMTQYDTMKREAEEIVKNYKG